MRGALEKISPELNHFIVLVLINALKLGPMSLGGSFLLFFFYYYYYSFVVHLRVAIIIPSILLNLLTMAPLHYAIVMGQNIYTNYTVNTHKKLRVQILQQLNYESVNFLSFSFL